MGDECGLNRRDVLIATTLLPLVACGEPKIQEQPNAAELRGPKKLIGELVELVALEPSIRLDIRYATANNVTGKVLYSQPRAFLVNVAAQALVRAHKRAEADGFGLTIFDAYRPLRVTKALWEATPPGPKRNYVANPKRGSKHNRGCAVDLTLHHLANGAEVNMPSGYDEFTTRAHRDFLDAPADALHHRAILQLAMEDAGFRGASNEWWHFDFNGWQDYPLLDVPFEDLA